MDPKEPQRFLSQLQREDRDALLAAAQHKSLSPEAVVFEQGQESDSVYVVVSGHLRVRSMSAEGLAYVIRDLRPGDLFGEIAFFDRKPRTAEVISVGDSVVAVLRGPQLMDLLRRRWSLTEGLFRYLAGRLRDTTESLEDQVFLRNSRRLAKVLLRLAEDVGERAGSTILITERNTHELLADRIGTLRTEVSRAFGEFRQAGWCERDASGRIRLLDADALRAFAEGDEE